MQKEEDLQNRILGSLYLDIKHMKELEEKIALGNRVAETEYSEIIMTAACASIMQMYVARSQVAKDTTRRPTRWRSWPCTSKSSTCPHLTFSSASSKAASNPHSTNSMPRSLLFPMHQ